MSRYGRITKSGLIYHVINRGNNKQVIFAEDEDYLHYLNTIQRYKKKFGFKLFAFCLMTNHVHMLIQVSGGGSISKIMQSITVAHTKRYNFKYQRSGHVWQGRFMSPLVSSDEHMLTIMRYIEQNPVRASMVGSVEDYHWSSYRLNVREAESLLLEREDNNCFLNLGSDLKSRILQYKQKMRENIETEKLEEIWKTTRKGGNYLSEKFQKQILELLPNRKKRGRPKQQNELIVTY
ncbi:MAG: transposase [Candidatus Omnitrophica bacterium]|nr:transposase [Candidatus Omnitrophota bacterium]